MQICYIYPGFPPEDNAGGIGTFAAEVVKMFSGTEHVVNVISRSERIGDSNENLTSNVAIYRLGEDPKSAMNSQLLFRKSGYERHYERVVGTLKHIYCNQMADVIEGCDWGAECSFLLSEYSDRTIIRCHTPAFIAQQFNNENEPYLSKGILDAEKLLLASAKHLAAPSRSLMGMIKDEVSLGVNPRIEAYPLDFSCITVKQDYEMPTRDINLISVGRIEQRKGQDIIFKACQLLASRGYSVRLQLIGMDTLGIDGRSMSLHFLEELGEPPAFELNLLGPLPRKTILDLYHRHDIFIAASRFDNFPFTLLEAMASGMPVVVNNNSGMAEILEGAPIGLTFDGDAEGLAERITCFTTEHSLRKSLGQAAKLHTQLRYSHDVVYRTMMNHYSQLCEASIT